MPTYGDTYYPSKMEGPGSRHSGRGLSRIWGDPFALATISIAILAWLIAFIGSIISSISNSKGYPNYSWWAISWLLLCIIGTTAMVATDTVQTFHVAAVGFLANGLFLASSSVNSLIYSTSGSSEAAAAGFILLAIIMIVWICYFGSQPQAKHRRFIDSFALHKSREESLRSSRMRSTQHFGQQATSLHNQQPQSTLYSTNHLRGLETSSPNAGTNNSTFASESQPRFGGPPNNGTFGSGVMDMDSPAQGDAGLPAPTEYPYKARAIYSYEANPDDANELSFQKHEILEVSDVSGRWWQARKSSGETGIAPSNYLILL